MTIILYKLSLIFFLQNKRNLQLVEGGQFWQNLKKKVYLYYIIICFKYKIVILIAI